VGRSYEPVQVDSGEEQRVEDPHGAADGQGDREVVVDAERAGFDERAEQCGGAAATTARAVTKKADVPSRLLPRNGCLPKRRPIRAAAESEMIRIANAVMTMTFGKMRTQRMAESST
jgi:hypothetical protein